MNWDEKLAGEITLELRWDPVLDGADIHAGVVNGVATLTGHVNSYIRKSVAETAARRVKGVRTVVNKLTVDLPSVNKQKDAVLKSAILDILKWNSFVPDDKIKVQVENGHVMFEGEVDWQYQREAVVNAVKYLSGVTDIANYITIRPKFDTTLIRENIRQALERNADIQADKVTIENEGNEVIVKGKVRSWLEKRIIEDAVWSSPGVTVLKDELEIV